MISPCMYFAMMALATNVKELNGATKLWDPKIKATVSPHAEMTMPDIPINHMILHFFISLAAPGESGSILACFISDNF